MRIGGTIWDDESMFPSSIDQAPAKTETNRYQKAFVDFFEDEMVRLGYDWKQVVAEYLFSGEEPIFNSIMADRTFIPFHKMHRNTHVNH
jgi:hypothetical protein